MARALCNCTQGKCCSDWVPLRILLPVHYAHSQPAGRNRGTAFGHLVRWTERCRCVSGGRIAASCDRRCGARASGVVGRGDVGVSAQGLSVVRLRTRCRFRRFRHDAHALAAAEFVVGLSAFDSKLLREQATLLLPIAPFSETSGTFVNCEGRWQSFTGAVRPLGETRPGWKVLRVLGNLLNLGGCDYQSSEAVRDELRALVGERRPSHARVTATVTVPAANGDLERIGDVPL